MIHLVQLGQLLVGVVYAAGLIAVGALVRRWSRTPVPVGARWGVDFLLGSLAVGLVVLALGVTGALTRPALAGVAVVLAGATWIARAQLRPPRGLVWALAGAAPLVPVALLPPFFYDALVYHLGLPWQALMEGGLRPHAENLFSVFPPLAQLVYAIPLACGVPLVPAVLHLAGFVLAAAVLADWAGALGARPWVAGLAAVALPLAASHALVPALPAAESWSVLAVLLALRMALSDRPGAAGLAGVLIGVAAAARLQGLAWTGVIVLAVAAVGMRPRWRRIVTFVAGWLVGSAPWWVKNLALLGDPMAPLGWDRAGMNTLWRDSGSVLHAAHPLAAALRAAPAALAPLALELGPLVLVALAGWFAWRRRGARAATIAALGGIVAWQVTGPLPRFLAPAVALLLVAVAAASRRLPIVAALAVILVLISGVVVNLREVRGLGGIRLVVMDPVSTAHRLTVNDPAAAFAAAASLPASAHVLFVGEPRPFAFPRRMTVTSQHDVPPIRSIIEGAADPAAAVSRLRSAGFTHLLVNWGELARLAPGYPVAPCVTARGCQRWQRLIDLLQPPVMTTGVVELFALSRSSPEPAAAAPGD